MPQAEDETCPSTNAFVLYWTFVGAGSYYLVCDLIYLTYRQLPLDKSNQLVASHMPSLPLVDELWQIFLKPETCAISIWHTLLPNSDIAT